MVPTRSFSTILSDFNDSLTQTHLKLSTVTTRLLILDISSELSARSAFRYSRYLQLALFKLYYSRIAARSGLTIFSESNGSLMARGTLGKTCSFFLTDTLRRCDSLQTNDTLRPTTLFNRPPICAGATIDFERHKQTNAVFHDVLQFDQGLATGRSIIVTAVKLIVYGQMRSA